MDPSSGTRPACPRRLGTIAPAWPVRRQCSHTAIRRHAACNEPIKIHLGTISYSSAALPPARRRCCWSSLTAMRFRSSASTTRPNSCSDPPGRTWRAPWLDAFGTRRHSATSWPGCASVRTSRPPDRAKAAAADRFWCALALAHHRGCARPTLARDLHLSDISRQVESETLARLPGDTRPGVRPAPHPRPGGKPFRGAGAGDPPLLPVLVCYIDVDRFGVINEAYGFDFGDRLIRLIADRLVEQCRQRELVVPAGRR